MRKHNGVRLDGGHSALAVLARRAASACMAVATVVGVVYAAFVATLRIVTVRGCAFFGTLRAYSMRCRVPAVPTGS